jgi:2-polyprenyl-6-hydroxyphenyl methylase/3-demethylubiquinone-9 3-methyltransferase
MQGYYSEKLSAERLRLCYEIAPLRVKRYLEAEIEFILARTGPADRVLELGCGYGRVLQRLAAKAKMLVGIDTSRDSLLMARRILGNDQSCFLLEMNAVDLGLRNDQFDMVVCVQNGVAVFHVDQRNLFEEAIRVSRSGGVVLFSSYSEAFWEERLDWFQIQAEHGLVGEIDYDATGHGVIVCKDGFRAATVSPEEFVSLAAGFGVDSRITEVDGSSVFCELHVG